MQNCVYDFIYAEKDWKKIHQILTIIPRFSKLKLQAIFGHIFLVSKFSTVLHKIGVCLYLKNVWHQLVCCCFSARANNLPTYTFLCWETSPAL